MYQCADCPQGNLPNSDRSQCIKIEAKHIQYSSYWAIAVCTVSAVGVCLSVVASVLYYMYRKTPILKASGNEISCLLLFGVISSYAATFIFVAGPSPFVCGTTRFVLGLCYTICYSAILTKTNRIYRIFKLKGTTPKQKRFTSSKSTIIITLMIIGVECIVLVAWLIFDSPDTTTIYPNRTSANIVCEDSTNLSYLGALIFPFMLMMGCIVFAILTRKTPDGFNETKHIAFCSYSSLVTWLAFIPIYFSVETNTTRVVTLCLSLSVNASVILICLFATKIYVVIRRPEKNTRENVMAKWKSSASVVSFGGVHPAMSPSSRPGMYVVVCLFQQKMKKRLLIIAPYRITTYRLIGEKTIIGTLNPHVMKKTLTNKLTHVSQQAVSAGKLHTRAPIRLLPVISTIQDLRISFNADQKIGK